jgi:MFS family permease
VQYTFLLCNVLYLAALWGWSSGRIGLALTPGPLIATVASLLGGRLADRAGKRPLLVAGSLLAAAGCGFLAARAGPAPAYAAVLLPGVLLAQAGTSLAALAANDAALTSVPQERLGTASALAFLARSFGAALGIAALAAILAVQALPSFRAAWAAMAGCALATVLLAAAMVRPAGGSRPPEGPETARARARLGRGRGPYAYRLATCPSDRQAADRHAAHAEMAPPSALLTSYATNLPSGTRAEAEAGAGSRRASGSEADQPVDAGLDRPEERGEQAGCEDQ